MERDRSACKCKWLLPNLQISHKKGTKGDKSGLYSRNKMRFVHLPLRCKMMPIYIANTKICLFVFEENRLSHAKPIPNTNFEIHRKNHWDTKKNIWDTKKKRYEIQKNCAPSTEVVTGPGSFPAPHENTFRENHISSFRIFYTLWMVQLYIEMVDKYKQIYFITYLLRLCSKPML